MDLSGIASLVIAALLGFFLIKGNKKAPVIEPPPAPGPRPTPAANLSPEVYPPFLVGELDWGGQFVIDMRHRLHGCDSSGLPVNVTGAVDPDDDLLRYRINVTGPDDDGNIVPYSVFSRDGKKINDQWLPEDFFPVVRKNRFDVNSEATEQEALAYCFVGHSMDKAPGGVFIPMRCVTPPPPVPVPVTIVGEMTVMYEARDPSGRSRSAAINVSVTKTSC